MSSSLDMSLDDIIKNNKKSSAASGHRGRGAGAGHRRRPTNRTANRSNPYSTLKAGDYGFYTDQIAAYSMRKTLVFSIETGTKLYISNLHYGVSNDDIKGTAEVVFARKEHALAAVKRYNNVQLDGKPMKIEVVGTNIEKPVAFAPVANGIFGNPIGIPRRARGRGMGGREQSRGGGRGGEKVSVANLDADLDKYHQEAMQTN